MIYGDGKLSDACEESLDATRTETLVCQAFEDDFQFHHDQPIPPSQPFDHFCQRRTSSAWKDLFSDVGGLFAWNALAGKLPSTLPDFESQLYSFPSLRI
jgi:hypothetical protein